MSKRSNQCNEVTHSVGTDAQQLNRSVVLKVSQWVRLSWIIEDFVPIFMFLFYLKLHYASFINKRALAWDFKAYIHVVVHTQFIDSSLETTINGALRLQVWGARWPVNKPQQHFPTATVSVGPQIERSRGSEVSSCID